ncbi:MAG: hypothetical protein Q9187_008006 [Circinaria calcarea]
MALIIDTTAIPKFFPYHRSPHERIVNEVSSVRRLDLLGALLFLGSSIFLVAALQEANVSYAWNSALVIILLVLSGAPFTCAVIQIPQRFQALNGLSSFNAGVRLLAYIVMVPVGAVIGAGLADKLKIKPTYALLIGTALQLVGAVNFALLTDTADIQPSEYGFQVILGAGSGISNAISTISVPFVVPRKYIGM